MTSDTSQDPGLEFESQLPHSVSTPWSQDAYEPPFSSSPPGSFTQAAETLLGLARGPNTQLQEELDEEQQQLPRLDREIGDSQDELSFQYARYSQPYSPSPPNRQSQQLPKSQDPGYKALDLDAARFEMELRSSKSQKVVGAQEPVPPIRSALRQPSGPDKLVAEGTRSRRRSVSFADNTTTNTTVARASSSTKGKLKTQRTQRAEQAKQSRQQRAPKPLPKSASKRKQPNKRLPSPAPEQPRKVSKSRSIQRTPSPSSSYHRDGSTDDNDIETLAEGLYRSSVLPQAKRVASPPPPPPPPPSPPSPPRPEFKAFHKVVFQGKQYIRRESDIITSYEQLWGLIRLGKVSVAEYCRHRGYTQAFIERRVYLYTKWPRKTAPKLEEFTLTSEYSLVPEAKLYNHLRHNQSAKAERQWMEVYDFWSNIPGDSTAINIPPEPSLIKPPTSTPHPSSDATEESSQVTPTVKKKKGQPGAGKTTSRTASDRNDADRQASREIWQGLIDRWACQDLQCSNRRGSGGVIGCYVLGGVHYELLGQTLGKWRQSIEAGVCNYDNPTHEIVEEVVKAYYARHPEDKKRKAKLPIESSPQSEIQQQQQLLNQAMMASLINQINPLAGQNQRQYQQPTGFQSFPLPQPPVNLVDQAGRSSPLGIDQTTFEDDLRNVGLYCRYLRKKTTYLPTRQALEDAERDLTEDIWTLRMMRKANDDALAKLVPKSGVRELLRKGLTTFRTWYESSDVRELSDSESSRSLNSQ